MYATMGLPQILHTTHTISAFVSDSTMNVVSDTRLRRGGERMLKKSRQQILLGSRTALLTVSAVRPEISQGSLWLCNVLFCGM